MTHPLRTTLAAISLVLCGLATAACVVSYVRPVGVANEWHLRDSEGDAHEYRGTFLAVYSGRAYLHRRVIVRVDDWTLSGPDGLSIGTKEACALFTQTWLPYTHETVNATFLGTFVDSQWTVPLWLLVLLFAILPVRWAVLRRRERRRNAAKVCVRCGYDLRACVERCSECGEPIPLEPEPA